MGLTKNLGWLSKYITADSAGKIGIGTATPNYGLNVVSSDITLSGIVSNRFIGIRKTSNTLPGYLGLLGGDNGENPTIIGHNSAGTQTFQIISTGYTYFNGGNVGIGTTSPAVKLQIEQTASGTTNNFTQLITSSDGGKGLYQGFDITNRRFYWRKNDSNDYSFSWQKSDGTNMMNIAPSGNLLLRTTTDSGYQCTINSAAGNLMYFTLNSASVQMFMGSNSDFYISTANNNGVKLAVGAQSWSAYSDIRLKNITGEIENALDSVNTLSAARFTLKSDSTNKPRVGLIAQEVQKILPEVIDVEEDGILSVRYTELIPLLVGAIKELTERIKILENK